MSRRSDLIQQLIKSDKWGKEKENEQRFLMATAELILTDLINIAITGVEKYGTGSLVVNLQNDSSTFMSGSDVEKDIVVAEREKDEDVYQMLLSLLQRINDNDWSKCVLITIISDAGTRTFEVEAGGSQESLSAFAAEFKE